MLIEGNFKVIFELTMEGAEQKPVKLRRLYGILGKA
jgi:hypothetical protein